MRPISGPARGYAVGLGRIFVIFFAAALAAAIVPAATAGANHGRTEFLVTLKAPSLATAVAQSRVLSARTRHARLDLRSPTSVSYARGLAAEQRSFARRLATAVPDAGVRWRYQVVLDGLSVVASPQDEARLARLPGVAHVYPAVRYHALERQGYQVIGAPALWGPRLTTAGQGIKIGIIDDGVDRTHRYLSPAGLPMPPGFPKGNKRYTTAKVIVARAFAPPHAKWRYARLPFDPLLSEHGTHVAGIAAGDYNTNADGTLISGVAPRAYLGNYKVLSIPTDSGVGPDGNAPEIVAGIEAAVRDGMDVINLSLGEPEVNPRRDPVIKAIDGAAEAGVVPAIAAGNDFTPFGVGSIDSPGSAPRAITAAAATKDGVVAGFSSSGPTPVSLRMKPDVTAPGVDILSSIPRSDGTWGSWSGTSMASPHVAGGAALLRQRHPRWTVAQIKSALVQTGQPVYFGSGHRAEVPPSREGGGMIDLPRADDPLLFTRPTSLSFGCLRPGKHATRTVALTDAGGGAGAWSVSAARFGARVQLRHPHVATVPGTLRVTASHVRASSQGSGFLQLTRGTTSRRIPFWYCGTARRLSRHGYGVLKRTGTYFGNTKHRKALVSRYRFPDLQPSAGVATDLHGPEQVFRVRIRRKVANFGVAVIRSTGPDIQIQPRVVAKADENRLTGYPALPLNLNPYLPDFLDPTPAAGAVLPARGTYDVVFDSASRANAGKFRFRFWINDRRPPRLHLLTRTERAGGTLKLRATDAGSGINPGSIFVRIDGQPIGLTNYSRAHRTITVSLNEIGRGAHRLRAQVSDYQESRNMEDVGPILPNTRTLRTRFTIK